MKSRHAQKAIGAALGVLSKNIPFCVSFCLKLSICTESGQLSSRKHSVERYVSFQCYINDSTDTVKITTLEDGSAMLKKVLTGPAPST